MAYSVEINSTSKELTKRDRVWLKDLSRAEKLDSVVTLDTPIVINPDFYAIMDVHNDKANPKDYKNFVVVDKDGTKYVTGSDSFIRAFMSIYEEMEGEEFMIEVYKLPSKNYSGKEFITCSLA